MTQLEKQNGDLRRQLDTQLYASKPAVDHDNPDKLSRDELVRRYSKISPTSKRDQIRTVMHSASIPVMCILPHRSITAFYT